MLRHYWRHGHVERHVCGQYILAHTLNLAPHLDVLGLCSSCMTADGRCSARAGHTWHCVEGVFVPAP